MKKTVVFSLFFIVCSLSILTAAGLDSIRGLKFRATDFDGNAVNESIFKKAKVTMVNVWATWCPPCRAELPGIGSLARKYEAKGCQVVAICADVTDEDDEAFEDAADILDDARCDFVTLKLSRSLENTILSKMEAFPTTLFFDNKGNVIGSIVGGRSEADFAKILDGLLKKSK